jgi:hypothetical protein
MAGLDLHDEVTFPPPPPAPVKVIPHVVVDVLNGVGLFCKLSPDTVNANWMRMIMRDSDIGNFIPHVPIPINAWVLAPLIICTSGSKNYFGPSSVQAGGKPIGVALLIILDIDLNCSDPVPLPSIRILAPATVVAGLSLGDILGGFLAMGADFAVQGILNFLTGSSGAGRIFGKVGKLVVQKYLQGVLSWAIQVATGSPLGWSLGPVGDPPSDGGHALGEWIGNHITGDRTIEQIMDGTQPNALAAPTSTPPATAGAMSGIVNDPGVEAL